MTDVVQVALIAAVPGTVAAFGSWRNGRTLAALHTAVDQARIAAAEARVAAGLAAAEILSLKAKLLLLQVKDGDTT